MDKENYLRIRRQTTSLSLEKKKSYISRKLDDNSSKSLYQIVDKILDKSKETILPKAVSDQELANQFQIFFSEKIIGEYSG